MYKKIMVPVDMAHVERLGKAIDTATDLAKIYSIPILLVGVTAETPTSIAHNPAEFAERLQEFGAKQSAEHGLAIETKAYPSHDPTTDLVKTLISAAADNDADLIVMASHVPGWPDHFFTANAGSVAVHAKISVFVVR
jgi:nucleotide-binding universal stress UspA family protein